MNQNKTPLYDALEKHSKKIPTSFHVPGHKNGEVFQQEAYHEFKSILKYDVTELSGLDDLHSPSEAIFEAESLLADHYKTKKSYFLVNGSTVGNLAMILASLQEEDVVLVQRNCHKSIMNGLQLAKVKPVFISPDFDTTWQVATGLSPESVQESIKLYPHAKALIVTNPNYYGMITNLKEIITICKKHQLVVLVDEARGAHFGSGKEMPVSAISLGADLVVQSAHKSLPAMTMGSYLHYNSEKVNIDKLELFLRMLQSSSPSYPIMASLDLARKYVATIEEEDIQYTLQLVEQFKLELSLILSIKVLPYPGEGDPLKISIQTNTELSGFKIQSRLEEYGIFTELADEYNVLFMFPLLKKGMTYPIREVVLTIKTAIGNEVLYLRDFPSYNVPLITTLHMGYKEQQTKEKELTSLLESKGRISAESIIPYPPGIPILLPGEEINSAHIKRVQDLIKAGTRFQGGENIKKLMISVFKEDRHVGGYNE